MMGTAQVQFKKNSSVGINSIVIDLKEVGGVELSMSIQ